MPQKKLLECISSKTFVQENRLYPIFDQINQLGSVFILSIVGLPMQNIFDMKFS